jgi:hypothetical protein
MPTTCTDYDFLQIEPHWQKVWADTAAFRTPAVDPAKAKYYVLDMFPYPSGAGLHLGHCENYTITDVLARYHRAKGKNVLYPIGWDAFGLPTENYAVKTGRHPREVTVENVATFRRHLGASRLSHRWGEASLLLLLPRPPSQQQQQQHRCRRRCPRCPEPHPHQQEEGARAAALRCQCSLFCAAQAARAMQRYPT